MTGGPRSANLAAAGVRVRIGIVADIHANLLALRAVLDQLGRVDALWCLGDVVNLGPDPGPCVDLLRGRGAVCVLGDHDRAVLGDDPTGKFFASPFLVEGVAWTRSHLTGDQLAYLAAQPTRRDLDGVTLAHDPGSLRCSTPSDAVLGPADLASFDGPCGFVAHTHVPLVCVQPGNDAAGGRVAAPEVGAPVTVGRARVLANPGSVGQNRVDAATAAYAVLEWERGSRSGKLVFERVAYPAGEVLDRRRRAKMPASVVEEREQFLDGTLPRLVQARRQHAAWYRF